MGEKLELSRSTGWRCLQPLSKEPERFTRSPEFTARLCVRCLPSAVICLDGCGCKTGSLHLGRTPGALPGQGRMRVPHAAIFALVIPWLHPPRRPPTSLEACWASLGPLPVGLVLQVGNSVVPSAPGLRGIVKCSHVRIRGMRSSRVSHSFLPIF